jgi:hypothetical protein
VTSEVSLGHEREPTPGETHIRLAEKFGPEKKYRRKSPPERRANLPDIIYQLVNPAGQCLRAMILKHYKQEASANVRCCSVCCPELLDELAGEPAATSRVRRRKKMMELVEAWLNGWAKEYYADRKTFWVPDYTYFISKQHLTAICSGEIITDEEDLSRRVPGWDPSILGPKLQSFLIKLRDAHPKSKRPTPKKRRGTGPVPTPKRRRGTGPVPQTGQHKRRCGSLLPYEVVVDLAVTNAEAVQSQADSLSQRRPVLAGINGNRRTRPYIRKNQ